MKTHKYLLESENTEKKFPNGLLLTEHQAELLHAAFGTATEGAEVLDILKGHLIYGKQLDSTHLIKECGDILWYIAIICRRLDVSLEEMMEINIRKLAARYPGKFSEEHAINRVEGDI